jgi:hypothetical protein
MVKNQNNAKNFQVFEKKALLVGRNWNGTKLQSVCFGIWDTLGLLETMQGNLL